MSGASQINLRVAYPLRFFFLQRVGSDDRTSRTLLSSLAFVPPFAWQCAGFAFSAPQAPPIAPF